MLKNLLIPDILSLLQQHVEGISEYLIIKSLEEHFFFDNIADDDQLAIFQKHFMVMNALYRMQKQLLEEEHLLLDISPLKIQLITTKLPDSDDRELTEHTDTKLSEYYLDWSNLESTNKQDVEKLLSSFWELYVNADRQLEALTILQLEEKANSEMVNRRYRELAALHHPDKGGDSATFIRIRQAYEILKP